ncbi:hypothetical protein P3X46_035155 [Hevea brasiliensis]|uniref:Peptidase A1 domain-containing protein n=1 Tax=Hevea brasiliensis TaxID=3981 RepID=A0ABQ9KCT3_HEVBR|nr:hypothetical protein P3X46_035155 [Hevea brasiliensis]
MASSSSSSSSSLHFLIFFFLAFASAVFLSESNQPLFKPDNLLLPARKDGATNLHMASIRKRNPQTLLQFLIDLNGRFLWVNCDQNYVSSTYHGPSCYSAQCSRANSDQHCYTCSFKVRPGCHNSTCALMSVNPVSHQSAMGELAQDVLSIQSIRDESNPGPIVTVPHFLFVCAPSRLLQIGLPEYVQGVAGLGHISIALPTQLASHFGFKPKFALCFTSSFKHPGFIFFGDAPSYMFPGIDVSRQMRYTPLMISRLGEYYIDVRSMRINQKTVPLTTTPYTVLERSIYQSFTQFFTDQLSHISQIPPVAPFSVCYDSRKFPNTIAGPGVPKIDDLVLGDQSVVWTIFGANSMVQAQPGVLCLGFLDGGLHTRDSIVIGAYQLEDNLVDFDLYDSRLGFSSSLLFQRTSCANFNSKPTP